jgi:hypothetical protein
MDQPGHWLSPAYSGDVPATEENYVTDESTEESQPLNREQRRARKFHRKARARQDNLQTQRENNTGFLTGPAETLADRPNEALEASSVAGSTNHRGPGTGGETETADREEHHEGVHSGNPSKG